MHKMIALLHHIDLSPNGITISQPHTSSVICVYMCMTRGLFHHWRPDVRRPLPCPPSPRQTAGTCLRPHFSKPPKYMHTAPSRQFQPLIATKIRHLNLLCLMTGGRTKYTLTNAQCNEPLPGFIGSDQKTMPRQYDITLLQGSSDQAPYSTHFHTKSCRLRFPIAGSSHVGPFG